MRRGWREQGRREQDAPAHLRRGGWPPCRRAWTAGSGGTPLATWTLRQGTGRAAGRAGRRVRGERSEGSGADVGKDCTASVCRASWPPAGKQPSAHTCEHAHPAAAAPLVGRLLVEQLQQAALQGARGGAEEEWVRCGMRPASPPGRAGRGALGSPRPRSHHCPLARLRASPNKKTSSHPPGAAAAAAWQTPGCPAARRRR